MPGGIRTLTVTVGFEVLREAVTLTSRADYDSPGNFYSFSRGSRPAYKFRITADALTKVQADSLNAFHFFHQGGKAFYFDGAPYHFVSSMQLVGEGDGVRRDFYLFNRNIDANSHAVAIFDGSVHSVTTAYSLNPIPGVISFSTAPDSGDDVLATHAHKYKVLFEPDGFKCVTFAPYIFRAEMLLTELAI